MYSFLGLRSLRMLEVHFCRSGMNELNWLARPIYECSSLMFFGAGKSLIAWNFEGSGLMPLLLMT